VSQASNSSVGFRPITSSVLEYISFAHLCSGFLQSHVISVENRLKLGTDLLRQLFHVILHNKQCQSVLCLQISVFVYYSFSLIFSLTLLGRLCVCVFLTVSFGTGAVPSFLAVSLQVA